MRTFKTDEYGDRVTKNGIFVYITGVQAVMQTCEQVMKQQLGELQYDKTKGIEYLNNVFAGTPNLQFFEAQARAAILAVTNVTGISSFTYEQVNNELSYQATIKTKFGNGEINGSI